MTTLLTEDCQNDDQNDSVTMMFTSLRFPLDTSMRIVFTGYFNGFNVEVRSPEEIPILYHMGCFGKGSLSRSQPKASQTKISPLIMRKRQYMKRNYWYKKFCGTSGVSEYDSFIKDVDELTAKIIADGEKHSQRDVIDLVSSDEEIEEEFVGEINTIEAFNNVNKEDIAVIVPDSDSEGENYFATMKPKCCLNKIKIGEKLMLSLQEAFFLMYGLGCLQIINLDNNILSIELCWDLFTAVDKEFLSKYVVYHYYRSKGYVVKPGIKFGGDYLLYKDGPGVAHADFIVMVKSHVSNENWVSILGHVRMANTTVKEIIIAEVIAPLDTEIKLPHNLNAYSIKELKLSRNMPVAINEDD